jgi:hypothetical protein
MVEIFTVSLAMRATALLGMARARTAIETAGGMITYANELASWSIALTVEIDRLKLSALHAQLGQSGVIWLEGSENRLLERASRHAESPPGEVIVLLHIEFISDEPERRLKVPAVPG